MGGATCGPLRGGKPDCDARKGASYNPLDIKDGPITYYVGTAKEEAQRCL